MAKTSDDVERGRACYAREEWDDAYAALARADAARPLEGDDLDRLVFAAGLTGRDAEFLAGLERVHHARLSEGRALEAARAAFWSGFRLLGLGEPARATGWLARARRLVDHAEEDCVVEGYLLLPTIMQRLMRGDDEGARVEAHRAAELGRRFDEPDLVALAQQLEGRATIRAGRVAEGLALVDEAMLAATAGELSPLVTGVLYCNVIATCRQVYALERSREWTSALSRWCARQPQLVTFTGSCRVHRSEVMELGGEWQEAIEEAARAVHRFGGAVDPEMAGDAYYQQAEIHRLRGERDEAARAYESASRFGRDPQPGLALLRLLEGKGDAAANATRRALQATALPLARARLLPAHVEILLAQDELLEAREGADELQEIADRYPTEVLRALAGHARGAILLAEGEPGAAVAPLRATYETWRQVGAPYLAARLRATLARAYDALGDVDGARLEREAARRVFEELGARPDLASLEGRRGDAGPGVSHGLTAREMEVLELLARGLTNKAIAAALFVSEKTIDRHVSNIYAKLDVPSRAAATAFAYENGLI